MNYSQYDVPIAIVVFNRLDCVSQLLGVIQKIKPEKLYVISDGARCDAEWEKVNEVRDYIETNVNWSCKIIKIYAEKNLGCDRNSIRGYTYVFEREETAILIEDDAIPTEEFFKFSRIMLNKYRDIEQIMLITGENTYPGWNEDGKDYFFSAMPPKKAWATWKRAWDKFDENLTDFRASKLGKLTRNYPFSAKVYYCGAYLGAYNGGKAWDVRWDYAIANNNGLGIIPSHNMVREIGYNREDATHTKGDSPNAYLSVIPYGRDVLLRDEFSRDTAYDKAYLSKNFVGSYGFLLREFVFYILRRTGLLPKLADYLEKKSR